MLRYRETKSMKPPKGEVPCKVGTQPWIVIFDRRCCFEVGQKVRMRKAGHGEKWFWVTLDNIEPIRVTL